jgi:hypothetical protein
MSQSPVWDPRGSIQCIRVDSRRRKYCQAGGELIAVDPAGTDKRGMSLVNAKCQMITPDKPQSMDSATQRSQWRDRDCSR